MRRSLRQPVCFSGGVAVLELVDLACWIDFARVPRAAKANNRSNPAVLTKEIPGATMVGLHALPPLLLLVTLLRDAATCGSTLVPQQHFTMLLWRCAKYTNNPTKQSSKHLSKKTAPTSRSICDSSSRWCHITKTSPRSTIEGPSCHKTQVPCCACRLKKWRHASIRLPVTPPCLLIVMHTDRVGHNRHLVFPRLAGGPRPCTLYKRRRGDGRHSNRLYIPYPASRIPHPACMESLPVKMIVPSSRRWNPSPPHSSLLSSTIPRRPHYETIQLDS